MAKTIDKVACRTPTPGKQPTSIPRWKFDVLRSAILASLPAQGAGIPFSDLSKLVAKKVTKRELKDVGSLAWHVTTVKLELEVRGEIKRIPKSSPQRLVRTA